VPLATDLVLYHSANNPDTDAATVGGNLSRFRRMLFNLVMNAVRHGGPHIQVSATTLDEHVTIEVADSGDPIPEDERELIFESFYASQRVQGLAPSVGLGLAISRRLAQMMSGELTYRHHEGWGTFSLTLPNGAGVLETPPPH